MPETTPAANSPANSSVGQIPAGDVSTSQAAGAGVAAAGAATSAGASAAAAGGGTQTQVAGAIATPSTPEYASVRDTLANYGLDLRERFGDDHAALQHLIGEIRAGQQAQQLASYGREFITHREQFGQWMRERQEAQGRQQQQQNQWFKAPEFDPRWTGMISRDPATGRLVAGEGAPPDLVQKYTAWASHQRDFLDKFSQNPIDAIKPGLQQVVQEMFQQQFQQQFGAQQQQQQARQIIEQNSDWMHERNAQGQVVLDPQSRQPRLNQWGQRYAQYVQAGERSGLQAVQDVHDYAFGLVQRDFLLSRMNQPGQLQQPAGDPGAAAKQAFIQQAQQAGQQTQQAGVPPAGNTNGAQPNRKGGARGLADAMLQKLQANGYMPEQTIAV